MTNPAAPHFDIETPIPSRTVSTCYVVRWHNDIVVIDAGEPGNVAHIMEAVDDARSAGGKAVRAILLTHPHPDHAGSLADIAAKTAAPVYASAFAGDALLNIGPFSPRLSHWHDDPVAEVASLKALATYDWRMLYPGHGAGVSRATFDRMIRKIDQAG